MRSCGALLTRRCRLVAADSAACRNISALSIAISYLSTYMYQCANVSLWPSTSFGLLDTSNDEYGATKVSVHPGTTSAATRLTPRGQQQE